MRKLNIWVYFDPRLKLKEKQNVIGITIQKRRKKTLH